MASALFYESNTEPLDGKRAVFDVITHRAEAYGMTVCQVVKQKGQFSWVGNKPMRAYTKEMKTLLTIVKSHPKILSDEMFMYFFRKELQPKWAKRMHCRVIGNHKFCRMRGKNG